MNSMNTFSIFNHDDKGEFRRIVEVSRDLDMLDFKHDAYAVNESKYPRRVLSEAGASRKGKRKVVEVDNYESDFVDDADPEGGAEDSDSEDSSNEGTESTGGAHKDTAVDSDESNPVMLLQSTVPLDGVDDETAEDPSFRELQKMKAADSAGLPFRKEVEKPSDTPVAPLILSPAKQPSQRKKQ